MDEWRSTARIDELLTRNDGVASLVLTGNGRGLAYRALAAARGARFSAASNLPADEISRSVFARIAGRADLGERSGTTLGVLSLATVLLPTPAAAAFTVSAASLAAPRAVRWLQDRQWDAVFVETATLIEEFPDLRLVVVDLNDAGPQDGAHLVELLDRRRSETSTPLAVLLVVDEPIASPEAVGSGHATALQRLAEWAARGEVEWFAVPPLETRGVRDALGCDELTATLLVEESLGQDLEAEQLWARWRAEKLVVKNAGQWQATAQLERHERLFTEVLGHLDLPPQIARDLLGIAAQFGLRFCSTSVVRAWLEAKPAFGESAQDDLQDAFDAFEVEGVLTAEGHLMSGDGTPCWIYGFRNAEYRARAVCLLPASEREVAAQRVLEAAADLHHAAVVPSRAELRPAKLDRELAELARRVGSTKWAERHQRRFERSMQVEELTSHVALLLRAAAMRRPDDPYPWHALYVAADQAYDLDEYATAVAAVDEAVAIAEDLERRRELTIDGVQRSQDERCRAHAMRSRSYGRLVGLHGKIHATRGERTEAIRTLTLARLHFEQAVAENATRTALHNLANAEGALAGSVRAIDGHEAALPGLQRARDLYKELVAEKPTSTARIGLAGAEGALAGSVRAIDGHEAALPGLQRARDLEEELVAEEPIAARRNGLAIAERSLAESVRAIDGGEAALPGLKRARDLYEELASEKPIHFYRRGLAIAEGDLARSVRAIDGHEAALAGLRQSRQLHERLLDEAHTLLYKRELAIAEDDEATSVLKLEGHGPALPGLQRARDLHEQVATEEPTLAHRRSLGIPEGRLAQSVMAVHGDKDALPILRRARRVLRPLVDDFPSSSEASWLQWVERQIARIEGGSDAH